MVTELSIQQCSAKFLNSEEFWKNALMWNRIWKNEDFYFDENNIDGLPIELPRCLHTPQQHLKAPRMNWAFIWRQAGQLISAMGWLRAQSHPLLSRYHLRLDKGEGCCYGQCLCGIQFIKGNQITQRVNNIEKKKKENIDVKSCADARRLRHAR